MSAMPSNSRRTLAALVVLVAFFAVVGKVLRSSMETPDPGLRPEGVEARAEPWSDALLELAATLPVQEGGRVKPLSTLASFQLLKLNGKRSLETPYGEHLGPTAWLLDCLFFPDMVRHYRCLLVDDSEVLREVGLEEIVRKRRARYSWAELEPGRERLREKAVSYVGIEAKERTASQQHLVVLWQRVHAFESLAGSLGFAGRRFPTASSPGLRALYGEEPVQGLAGVLAGVDGLRALFQSTAGQAPGEAEREVAGIEALSATLEEELSYGQSAPTLLPPTQAVAEQDTWLRPADLIRFSVEGGLDVREQLELLASLERLTQEADDPAAFTAEFAGLHSKSTALATARGEYRHIEREVDFYRWNYFMNALVFFLGGFVLAALSWMAPRNRLLWGGVWISMLCGAALLVAGVVLRCIIRERPPVSTLYETILFISGCAVLVCVVIEWINRQRVALSTAALLGAGGMFLAMRYEFTEAQSAGDTMPALVAVLDTNFWLATHVTTVTLGYSAGLLAAALAHVWLVMRIFRLDGGDAGYRKGIARMVYGVLCFGLLFSVVGTILGGVWANYSWGRFWGWDPKENGALMICLAELFILHMRLGGYIKDFGVAVLAVGNAVVIAFSWWHVNHLGIGLHSYGFTEGIVSNLNVFYQIEACVIGSALLWRFFSRAGRGSAPLGAEGS